MDKRKTKRDSVSPELVKLVIDNWIDRVIRSIKFERSLKAK